ncbi:S-DNA-T family DNA segregation ATPase FtsK/SpoIIIE [Nonomuraea polychroma]|uniref:S-DNA-T family DNA segregation ATPase FtsK/SpoIIIE n=1 Tax=Nonomuraea polychroma TaxID=46176 RepID=A0A438MHU6_9ACTN|nr:FtsK/SpoIIIE domain-containing protein [Nonomuraea polychroma]RVX45452.1 S-DNA-T family DNA segregation ATPase FtsK/SpoIIIE [Nonomuraea polychroma]
MLRRTHGEVAGDLVTTTPGAPLMFRPTVVQTPAIITITILIWRFASGLVRLVYRHPIAVAISLGLAALAVLHGWKWAAGTLSAVIAALAWWCVAHRSSFSRWVGWRLLACWRLASVYRPHWSFAMSGAGLSKLAKSLEYRPRLVRVKCGPVADTVTVKMLKGQSFDDWTSKADNLAHAFGALSCRTSIVRAGLLRLSFPRRDPLRKPIKALPIPDTVNLLAVPIGLCEDGSPWTLKVHGTHILGAGATGAGKGSIIWSTLRGLLPAIRAGLVRPWGLDPKLMELSYGRELFYRYAATPEDCADLLDELVSLMQERAGLFGGHQRSHIACLEYPFELIIIDEIAFLTAYQADRDLKKRINAALATLTTQGRAVGYGVMALLQDPRKEVMNIRNLFPDKIAMRLDESEQVDMVLGEGARERGALADFISPVPTIGAGVAYVRLETSPEPVRVRAAYVSDGDIRDMVAWLNADDYGDTLPLPEIETGEVA